MGQETGITPGWANAAHDVDPELAKSAADDWDKGDHAKAVGKFVYATGESIVEGVSDFIDGVTGHVDAVAPPDDSTSRATRRSRCRTQTRRTTIRRLHRPATSSGSAVRAGRHAAMT